jgi:hypothetical protein
MAVAALLASMPAGAGILYDNSIPGGTGPSLSPEFVYLTEVLVPVSRNGLNLASFDVTRVTVKMSLNLPLTENVTLFYAPAGNDAIGTPTPSLTDILNPPYRVTSTTITGPGASTIVFGDGVSTLFSVPLNTTSVPGYDLFWVGLSGSGTPEAGEFENWMGGAGPDTNRHQAYLYDEFTSTKSAISGSFNVLVEGPVTIVPEPGTLALVCAAMVFAMARRRRPAR